MYQTYPTSDELGAALGGAVLFGMIIYLVVIVVFIAAYWQMFKKAGMPKGLQDPLNKVLVEGHYGPHPTANKYVFEALQKATTGLQGQAYGTAFRQRLAELGTEAQTPGTPLNKLVTGAKN